ncbi:MAG: hypothetical protein NZM43_13640 [Saprospiraceae bacterium]|nr:hypothetical protein [Saprospiraceae bacterium]MDW8485357.1 hypothetical protein [Saprospiraceae bacterium]
MSYATNLITFYTALREAVRLHSPNTTLPCKRLQTFRVFAASPAQELLTQTLGATVCDKDKPFFFSREWHERRYNPNEITWQYPLLFAFEVEAACDLSQIEDGIVRARHTLQVGVLDVVKDVKSAAGCKNCEGRTPNEIYLDTQQQLFEALLFVKRIGIATFDDGTQILCAPSAYDATFTTLNMIEEPLNAVPLFRIERPAERVYGTGVTITIKAQQCDVTKAFDTSQKEYGVLAHEAGCSNC